MPVTVGQSEMLNVDLAENMSDISGMSSDNELPEVEKYLQILSRNILANDVKIESPKLHKKDVSRVFLSP